MGKYIRLTRQLVLAGGLLACGLAAAKDHVAIHFANHGSIRDWQPDDKNALFVQDNHKQWYRATFWTPCFDLPFAIGIGFVTGTMDELDEYSSVIVGGERCMFKTFEKSDPPPVPEKRKKAQSKDDKDQLENVPAADKDAKPQE